MNAGDWIHGSGRTAAELSAAIELEPGSRALLRPDDTPRSFVAALMQNQKHADAVKVMGHALDLREAVWWSCRCARSSFSAATKEAEKLALAAAVRWVAEPSEEHRRACFTAAEASGFGCPAGLASLAAYWSGGSISPVGLPDVPVPPGLTHQAASSCAILSAVAGPPETIVERYAQVIALGEAVVTGDDRWVDPPKTATQPAPTSSLTPPAQTASRPVVAPAAISDPPTRRPAPTPPRGFFKE